MGEYAAATHFLAQGQQVYWPAVQQGSDDFIVRTPAGYRRVQVKLASWSQRARHRWLRVSPTRSGGPAFEEYDILVVVHGENLWAIPASLLTTKIITLYKTNPNAKASPWEPFRHTIIAATGATSGVSNGRPT